MNEWIEVDGRHWWKRGETLLRNHVSQPETANFTTNRPRKQWFKWMAIMDNSNIRYIWNKVKETFDKSNNSSLKFNSIQSLFIFVCESILSMIWGSDKISISFLVNQSMKPG